MTTPKSTSSKSSLDGNKTIWLRQAFLLPVTADPKSYGSMSKRRYANSAAFKFENTTLGGNFAINPLPQYTRYADIRQPGRGRTWEQRFSGMGRYYSEAHDDTKQEIVMSFGNPSFSSWTSFFTNFYDRSAASIANHGVSSKLWYNLGLAQGYFITLPLQPFIMGLTGVNRVYNFLSKNSPSKWFYFKPAMHTYWSAVNTIANEMSIGMGLTPRVWSDDNTRQLEQPNQPPMDETFANFQRLYPNLFRKDGGFDIMSLATRTQRMADRARDAEDILLSRADTIQELRTSLEGLLNMNMGAFDSPVDSKKYFEDHLAALGASENPNETQIDGTSFSSWTDLEDWYEFVRSSQRDGSQFITVRAEYNGEVSESFSNSTRDVGIASTLNTKVMEGRSARYNFMDGNITDGIGAVKKALGDFVSGALDSVNLSGLETLTGTAFIDVPEHWESSMMNLPSATYTVNLHTPYGNKLSRFLFMYIPIAMLLPMVLPRSAGRSAYTSPFICQLFHRGRAQRQLGICSDFSIRRGTGNVGWNAEHEMLNCEISFTIKDLSKIMHMPIKAGFASDNWLGTAARGAAQMAGQGVDVVMEADNNKAQGVAAALTDGAVWDEQSLFQDYIASLTSMSWSELFYVGKRLNYNITRSVTHFNSWKTPSNFMSWALDSEVARLASAFAASTDRLQ